MYNDMDLILGIPTWTESTNYLVLVLFQSNLNAPCFVYILRFQ